MSVSNISHSNPMATIAIRNSAAAKLVAEQQESVIASASNGNRVDALKMHNNGMVATSTNAESTDLTSQLFGSRAAVATTNYQGSALGKSIDLQPTSAKEQFDLILAQTQGLKLAPKSEQVASYNVGFHNQVTSQEAPVSGDSQKKYGIDDLYLDFALNSYQRATEDPATQAANAADVRASEGVAKLDGDIISVADAKNPNEVVDLEDVTLDFSALLPPGMRQFLADLKCTPDEMNKFVNVMVFGNEAGPHGQKASDYFGQDTMTLAQLQDKISDLSESAKLNVGQYNGEDYALLLRPNGNAVGQTLQAQGLNLNDRAIEQGLENTFKSDMALMQVLAHVNNQNASIF